LSGGISIKNHTINEQIRAKEVRLIGHDGEQIGVVSLSSALERAAGLDLDLVLVSDNATPPVCKLVNYGQYRYQQQKKEKLAKKSSKAQVVKELKISPKISDHDFQVKLNKALEFLEKSYTVKLLLAFKGREMMHPELGENVVKRFIESVSEKGSSEQGTIRTGRALVTMINPK
jgi:translation initiation factor IF-3